MRKLIPLFALLLTVPLFSCRSEDIAPTSSQLTSQAFLAAATDPPSTPQLKVEQVILARNGSNGKLEPVNRPVFKRGESVNIVLLNVQGFQKGSDGKNRFDLDMEVKDPQGKVILSRQRLLGQDGHRNLPRNIARSPSGIFNTTEKLEPGTYTLTLTLYDLVGKGLVTKSKIISLK